jgi:hypothetical protein
MNIRIKKLAVVLGVFMLTTLGWNGFVWYKQALLSDRAAPFFAACQSNAGCMLAPDGWEPDNTGGFYNGFYEYTATKENFTLRQHLAIDVWLVAEGGKDKPVRTHRIVD